MNNQDRFKEALDDLLIMAKASGLTLTSAQIDEAFAEFDLDEEKQKLVLAYLGMNQITVTDAETDEASVSYLKGGEKSEEPKEKKLTGADSKAYKMYLEEIAGIKKLTEEELSRLIPALLKGDQAARNRVTEGYLPRVVELSHEYAGQGVLLADLVQEGNMALFMAAATYEGGDFGVMVTREICSAMEAAIAEQTGQEETGSYLAAQSNAMMKATEELVNELGREATLEEVAAKMHLSEEITRDIMKISMDALTVTDANKTGETFGQ